MARALVVLMSVFVFVFSASVECGVGSMVDAGDMRSVGERWVGNSGVVVVLYSSSEL